MTVYWPRGLFVPRDPAIDFLAKSTMGPPALSGFRQSVASKAGAWRVVYAGIPVMTPSQIKLWRGLDAQIGGRSEKIVLPVYERSNLYPVPLSFDVDTVTDHSDGSEHSDGSGYAQPSVPVVLSAVAALGTTSLVIAKTSAVTLEIGQHFSIADRLYRIKAVDAQADTTATIRVVPPLRRAGAIGESLNFATPSITVRLATDDQMKLTLSYGKQALTTVEFIEDPN
jgi:hypothetical protein